MVSSSNSHQIISLLSFYSHIILLCGGGFFFMRNDFFIFFPLYSLTVLPHKIFIYVAIYLLLCKLDDIYGGLGWRHLSQVGTISKASH
uniref:Uncharacterized protein n=1 Tax=Oryza brachyantha TaxID=4533 RepID=J3N7E3_ORYBR